MIEKVAGPRWETAKFVGSLAGTGAAALGMGSLIANAHAYTKGKEYGQKNDTYKGRSILTDEQKNKLRAMNWADRDENAINIATNIYDKKHKNKFIRNAGRFIGRRSFYSGLGKGSSWKLDSKKDRKLREAYENIPDLDINTANLANL